MKTNDGSSVERKFWGSKVSSDSLLLALCELAPQTQFAIYLRFWEANTIEEIAKQLSLKWSVVDQMLEVALKDLRLKIGEELFRPTKADISAS